MNKSLIFAVLIVATYIVFVIYRCDRLTIGESTIYRGQNRVAYECELPLVDPWHSNVRKYFRRLESPLKTCVPQRKVLTRLVNGTLSIFEPSLLLRLGITQFRCLYPLDDYNLHYGNWTTLINVTDSDDASNRPNCDIVEVRTTNTTGVVTYRYVHTQIYVGTGESKPFKQNVRNNSSYQPSVFVFVLDSTSSSQGLRSLSETMQLLTVNFDAVHFRYLNRVGLTSRPNAQALFFGERLHSIGKSIYGERASKPPENPKSCSEYVDVEKFVGNYFRKNGYVSLIAEDWALGAFNWPSCQGFKQTPATHYMRPFQLRTNSGSKKYFDRNLQLTLTTGHCREWHEYIMDYVKAFHLAYPRHDQPKWSLTWLSYLAHDSFNGLYHVDGYFADFFAELKELLAESFVIVIGDHGFRASGIRGTNAGRIEENNPLLSIAVPQTLRRSRVLMQNLQHNSRQLISHYDIYATLIDIATIAPKSNWTDFDAFDFEEIIGNRRGASLLRRLPPSIERNCETMEIPFEFCMCQLNRTPIANTHVMVIDAANFLVNQLNGEISTANATSKCVKLRLGKILLAELIVYRTRQMYNVQFSVVPSNGQFEALCQPLAANEMNQSQSYDFELMSDIIVRLNTYGKQGDCVRSNSRLRPICYCNNQV